jgi:hypothetical protein
MISIRYTLSLAVAVLMTASCQGRPEAGTDGNTDASNARTLSINPDRTTVLKNPLNGWVMYVSATSDPSYFDTKINVPELGKDVLVRDYVSACYIRTGWKAFNPADGKYAWDDPSTNLYKLIKRAEELEIPIAFRVVVDGRDQRENTPQFVFDAGAQYWLSDAKYPDRKTPLAIDPVWRKYYEKFVKAFAERFNDPSVCAFIDAYGLGKWGEGHNVCYEQNNAVSAKTSEYKADTMEWITKLYSSNFTKIPLVINYHRHIGHPVSEGAKAESDSETVLQIALDNGYSLRSDAFGMNNNSWGYNNWERTYVKKWEYKVPVIMEGGWIVGQHSYWNDELGYRKDHPEDVRKGEFDASAEAHVNMMDFRVGDETRSWFQTSFSLVERFISEGGYRLYPDRVSLPSTLKKGAGAKITHRWRNLGWGYLPNNIRQWNYKYKVAFALIDSEGKVAQLFIDDNCEPSDWRQGNPKEYTFDVKADVKAGIYLWAVAIVDTTLGNTPGIRLAAAKLSTTEDGWTKLANVTVE